MFRNILRKILPLLILLTAASALGAASVSGGIPVREGLFYSEEELCKVDFSAPLSSSERSYYEECRIYIVTASATEPVYAYFGHAGIEVEAPGSAPVMFDYGTFAFGDGFYLNFALGLLYYSLNESYADFRLDDFISDDRTVRRLELELTAEEKRAVIAFLTFNAEPENSTYLYHYYKDNCATRIRDIYNATTGGEFRKWAENIETGRSFRDWSTPYMAPSFFFAFLLNYLQGPEVDRPVNLYEACFLPDVLLSSIEEYEGRTADTLHQSETRKPVSENYSLTLRTAAAAIVFAIIICLASSRYKAARVLSDLASGVVWLFLGVLSAVLLFMMTATNHDVTYWNANVLVISPLVLANAFLHFASIGKKERRRALMLLSRTLLAAVSVLLAAKGCLMGTAVQDDIAYYILAITAYAAEYLTARYACRRAPQQQGKDAQDR